jgi:hypothetical protein
VGGRPSGPTRSSAWALELDGRIARSPLLISRESRDNTAVKSPDLFICHAGEDKKAFVRPLAESLRAYGADVWYDEFTLRVGDSLSRTIDRGLAAARYVVVISKAFLAKKWPEYELRGLVAKELAGNKVILPVWLNVTKANVLRFSPPLADKLALRAAPDRVDDVAVKLLEVARPDLFEGILRERAWREVLKKATRQRVKRSEVKIAPIRHKQLPSDLIGRIRLIRAALMPCVLHSMDYWVDGFQRDMHPADEIAWWEHVAAAFLEYIHMTKLTRQQIQAAFHVVVGISSGSRKSDLAAELKKLPKNAFANLKAISKSIVPPFDIVEKLISEQQFA